MCHMKALPFVVFELWPRDNPGMGHCQFMRKVCKIEEIWHQIIWKGPLYNLSKYAVSFGLGPQIRVHRPLHFPWWPPVFANGPLFLSILYTFYKEGGHWPIFMAPPLTNPEYSLMANVKTFQKLFILQGQGHKVKSHGTMWKMLS